MSSINSRRSAGFASICAGMLLACFMSDASAVPTTYDAGPLVFNTNDQSMWGPGSALQLSYSKFLGKTWDASQSFGPGVSCVDLVFTEACGGAEATVSTNGKIGFQIDASLDSGSVDATVQMNAQAVLPDPLIGANAFFNLNPTSALTGGQFTTSSPSVQASLDAVLGAHVGVSGAACVAACLTGSTGFGIGDKNNPETLNLVDVNTGNSGNITVLGQTITGTHPIDVAGTNVGNVTANIPIVDTTGGVTAPGVLSSSGHDDLLTLTADIDGLITLALGLPPLEGSVDFGIGSLDYNILDVELGPQLNVFQDFELKPTLMVDLEFNNDVLVDFGGGNIQTTRSLIAPWNSLPDIAMTVNDTIVSPTWFLDAQFLNQTGLGVDLLFQFSVLSGSIDLFGVFSGGVGPLFSFNTRLLSADFPPIFDQQFALGGFNAIQGPDFTIHVPEPATLALFGMGLFVLVALRRRARRPVAAWSAREAAA